MEMVLAQKLAELGNARSPAVGGGGKGMQDAKVALHTS